MTLYLQVLLCLIANITLIVVQGHVLYSDYITNVCLPRL